MAPKYEKDQDTAYTNFTIRVDVGNNWTKTVEQVVNSVKGVTSFRMEDDGKVHISGYIEPNVLLKCLQKNGITAHLMHWQYEESKTNFYRNGYGVSYSNGNGYNNYYSHQQVYEVSVSYNYIPQPSTTYEGDPHANHGDYSHQPVHYEVHNNNVSYNYISQPSTTSSYPPRGDPYANHEEISCCCIM